jgi:F0F1-type ATP synthase assembly protein I
MSPDTQLPSWVRLSGVGLELAGAVAGFTLIGYWIDSRYATGPWGVVIGVVLGLIGGLYNLVRQSLVAAREARAEDQTAALESSPESDGLGD